MDALVWAATDLLGMGGTWEDVSDLGTIKDYESPWR
jgi:hypothetical protein